MKSRDKNFDRHVRVAGNYFDLSERFFSFFFFFF